MSIIGVGTDLVPIARIEGVVARKGKAFARRILSESEYEAYLSSSDKTLFLAKCFASKEAVAKALGTGIARGVSWRDISYQRRDSGAPQAVLTGEARSKLESLGAKHVHLSLAHDAGLVQSFAVLSN